MNFKWKLVVAFVAMCLQDVLSTMMVIAEARLNAPLAGVCDVAGWLLMLASSGLAIDTIVKQGWGSRQTQAIVAAVSMANFVGTFAGVATAGRIA